MTNDGVPIPQCVKDCKYQTDCQEHELCDPKHQQCIPSQCEEKLPHGSIQRPTYLNKNFTLMCSNGYVMKVGGHIAKTAPIYCQFNPKDNKVNWVYSKYPGTKAKCEVGCAYDNDCSNQYGMECKNGYCVPRYCPPLYVEDSDQDAGRVFPVGTMVNITCVRGHVHSYSKAKHQLGKCVIDDYNDPVFREAHTLDPIERCIDGKF